MTKVEVHYDVTASLTDEHLEAIQKAHGHYGLQAVKLSPKLDEVTVLFDASRMKLEDVDATLARFGLPLKRRG